MTREIAAHDRESLDALVWRATGGAGVEQVLELNPGLAVDAAALPIGTLVRIPDAPVAAVELDLVQLWD